MGYRKCDKCQRTYRSNVCPCIDDGTKVEKLKKYMRKLPHGQLRCFSIRDLRYMCPKKLHYMRLRLGPFSCQKYCDSFKERIKKLDRNMYVIKRQTQEDRVRERWLNS